MSKGTCGASGCDDDRTITCENSLCAGCMDPGFDYAGSTSDPSDCSNGFENVSGDTSPTGIITVQLLFFVVFVVFSFCLCISHILLYV